MDSRKLNTTDLRMSNTMDSLKSNTTGNIYRTRQFKNNNKFLHLAKCPSKSSKEAKPITCQDGIEVEHIASTFPLKS